MLWNVQIQYSYVMLSGVMPHYWQDDVSGSRLKF
jgi:hypothetical protein